MDLATVLGLLIGWGAVFLCLMIEGGSVGELLNVAAAVVVFGGTAGATIISVSMDQLLAVPSVMRKALFRHKNDQVEIIKLLVELARKARREGILALEADVAGIENRFLKMGMQLIIDGTPSELVKEVLETEIVAMQERHKSGETVFATAGGFAPTLGIIGTVMGLINMLARLNEPGKMGHAIAAAFVATLYGVSVANLLFLPIGSKLKANTTEEVISYEMILEGVLAIQAGLTPRMIEMKMMAFLPPKLRDKLAAESESKELPKAA